MKHAAPPARIWIDGAIKPPTMRQIYLEPPPDEVTDSTEYVRADLHEAQVKLLGELVGALNVYGTHSDRCSWWDNPLFENCNCGYAELLTHARKVQESDKLERK